MKNELQEEFLQKEAEEHELLRQKVSSICSAFEATEEHPIDCSGFDMELHIDLDEVAQGLSEMEKPQLLSVFHDPECIVWIVTDFNEEEPIELDDILTDSIREILRYLEENLNASTDNKEIADGLFETIVKAMKE